MDSSICQTDQSPDWGFQIVPVAVATILIGGAVVCYMVARKYAYTGVFFTCIPMIPQ